MSFVQKRKMKLYHFSCFYSDAQEESTSSFLVFYSWKGSLEILLQDRIMKHCERGIGASKSYIRVVCAYPEKKNGCDSKPNIHDYVSYTISNWLTLFSYLENVIYL